MRSAYRPSAYRPSSYRPSAWCLPLRRLAVLACGMLVLLLLPSRLASGADEASTAGVGLLLYAPEDGSLDLRAAPSDIGPFYRQLHAPPYPRDLAAAALPTVPPWLLATVDGEPRADRVARAILPVDADRGVQAFVAKNLVVFDRSSGAAPPLLVWMSGTGGTPLDAGLFLVAAADAGYRVIGLEFDSLPAGTAVCDSDADPSCFARYRAARVWGIEALPALGHMPAAEAIVRRLTRVLELLASRFPDEHWGGYLEHGEPAWSRIVLSGQSMGSGMAAFLAKQRRVARVVLSSSPWDHRSPSGALAPWLSGPSLTPLDRWYGLYHQREPMAPLLQRAYAALGLDPRRILVSHLTPQRLLRAPATSMVFHGCWYGAAVPLDAQWRPTPEVKRTWSFLLGQAVR